jgi:hypothetical protein
MGGAFSLQDRISLRPDLSNRNDARMCQDAVSHCDEGRNVGLGVTVTPGRQGGDARNLQAQLDPIMEFDDVILGRRSIRGYKPDPVPRALIEEILALAMRAPSSMNTQPWNFTLSPANRSIGFAPAIPSAIWPVFRTAASSASARPLSASTVIARLASPSSCLPPWTLRATIRKSGSIG